MTIKDHRARPLCSCGNLAKQQGATKLGFPKFSKRCSSCQKKKYGMSRKRGANRTVHTYRKSKGTVCERCGFVPENSCQLDVDHIDGNHSNHDKANLQTLCANCHRLKTMLNGDGIYSKART